MPLNCEHCEYEVCNITTCLCICHGHPEDHQDTGLHDNAIDEWWEEVSNE